MNSNILTSTPAGTLSGHLTVPGDKSISHRALILAALAKGQTIIQGFLRSADCLATRNALQHMGIRIDESDSSAKNLVVVHGIGKHGFNPPAKPIDCGNSASTMRLLSGLLAAQPFASLLTGDASLLKRPMTRIVHPLRQMGASIPNEAAPLAITGSLFLRGIGYTIREASAQVKTCLLIAGMHAKGETQLTVSAVTRDHTERLFKAFAYPCIVEKQLIKIDGAFNCTPCELHIPGDFSSAAYFIVAASITPGSDLIIKDVGINSTRTGLLSILNHMGANIRVFDKRWYNEEPVANIHIKYTALKGIQIPPVLVPLAIDEFPILFIAAACAKGDTIIRGADELRLKESDRIAVMAEGLCALGVHVKSFKDGLLIRGGSIVGGRVNSCGDHRVAMAFAVAGAVARDAIVIDGCENIKTSFPQFITHAQCIGMNLQVYANDKI